MYVRNNIFSISFMKYYILSLHGTKEELTAMFLKKKREQDMRWLRAVCTKQCCSFSQFANGRCRCLNYNQIRSNQPAGVGSFHDFQPAGILSEKNTVTSLPSLAVLPPTDVSVLSYIDDVMGAAMEAAPGYRTRNSIFEHDKARPHGDLW